jgi:hypothetical protein
LDSERFAGVPIKASRPRVCYNEVLPAR